MYSNTGWERCIRLNISTCSMTYRIDYLIRTVLIFVRNSLNSVCKRISTDGTSSVRFTRTSMSNQVNFNYATALLMGTDNSHYARYDCGETRHHFVRDTDPAQRLYSINYQHVVCLIIDEANRVCPMFASGEMLSSGRREPVLLARHLSSDEMYLNQKLKPTREIGNISSAMADEHDQSAIVGGSHECTAAAAKTSVDKERHRNLPEAERSYDVFQWRYTNVASPGPSADADIPARPPCNLLFGHAYMLKSRARNQEATNTPRHTTNAWEAFFSPSCPSHAIN